MEEQEKQAYLKSLEKALKQALYEASDIKKVIASDWAMFAITDAHCYHVEPKDLPAFIKDKWLKGKPKQWWVWRRGLTDKDVPAIKKKSSSGS